MLNKIKLRLLFFSLISLAFVSCQNSNKVTEPVNNNINGPVSFVPINLELTATLTIYKSVSYNSYLNKFITTSACDAAFYNSSDYSVSAGIVTLNNDTIPKYSEPTSKQAPDSLYAYGYQPYDISFNGTNYNWVVNGSNDFQSLSESISSPNYEVSITSPANGANISKSSDLTITWSNSPTPSDTVHILITSNDHALNKFVDDTGSYTFSSNDLSIFNIGDNVSIEIASGNYKFKPVGNKYALISIFSSYQIYGKIVQ